MRRISGLLGVGLILLLAGCGMFPGEKREPWRSQAEAQCLARKHVRASQFMQPMKAISGPGACGMDSPFRVTAVLNGTVTLKSRGVLACPMIAALEQWVGQTVLPAAQQYYGAPVAQIHFGTYACRRMNNRSSGRRSEHSYGNAADFMSMTLADGRSVNVRRGWRGSQADREFLRTIFTGACGQFGTVLGPGADAHHDDHLHLDLARHSRGRSICRPVIKWSPMVPAPFEPGPGGVAQSMAISAAPYGAQTPPAEQRFTAEQPLTAEQPPTSEPASEADVAHDHDAAAQDQGYDQGEPQDEGLSQGRAGYGASARGGARSIDDLLR